MDKQEINIDPLFQNIAQLIEKGQQTIIRSVNYSQLYVNYHIGKYIVDDEQDGIRLNYASVIFSISPCWAQRRLIRDSSAF